MPGDDIKQRIVAAALETLRRDGIVGASARAIARTGDFNQALIFYHYGSVQQVLLAALDAVSGRRLARYESRLAAVASLPELVAVAAELHREDVADGHVTVLAQLLAGSSSSSEFRSEVLRRVEPWTAMVQAAIERVVTGTPAAGVVPTADLAMLVSALFLGFELLADLDDASLFGTLEAGARLLAGFLGDQSPDKVL